MKKPFVVLLTMCLLCCSAASAATAGEITGTWCALLSDAVAALELYEDGTAVFILAKDVYNINCNLNGSSLVLSQNEADLYADYDGESISLYLDAGVLVFYRVSEPSDIMSYAEYAAAEIYDEVIVETYVQAHQSWWDDKITVYCQSEDGAYFAYELACSEEDAARLVPGTKIRIHGYKSEFAGEIEIIDGTFEFVEGGDTFIAEALDVTELLGTEAIDEHMNKKVAFKGLTVEAIEYKNGEPGDDVYLTLGYNGASYGFCVEIYLTGEETEVYNTVGTLKVGDVVDVEAFLYYYEGINPHITAITVAE